MECEFQDVIRRDLEVKENDSWSVCHTVDENNQIVETHIVPIDDLDGHEWGLNCHCEPRIEYKDPETGKEHTGPIVVHNAFDGRHVVEQVNRILKQL